jgi:hypothetical protein
MRNASKKRRGGILPAALLTASVAFGGVGVTLMTTAPATADVLGPGSGSGTGIPGFIGYSTNGNHGIGIGKLPNGRYGICVDAGIAYDWPTGRLTSDTPNASKSNYILDKYLPQAVNNSDGRRAAEIAAAVWWSVGLDLGENSHPSEMRDRLALMKSERPAIYGEVKALRDQMLTEANAYRAGYSLPISISPTDVANIGAVSASGSWVPGAAVTLTLTNGTFNSNGSATYTWTSSTNPGSLSYTPNDPTATTKVHETISNIAGPNTLRYYGGSGTQHVLVRGATQDLNKDVSAQPAQAAPVPLTVTKAAEDGDPSGLIGVSISVHAGSETGPVVDRHTFDASDIDATTKEASFTFGANYDPNLDYFVIVDSEPTDWKATDPSVPAVINGTSTLFTAHIDDNKVFHPTFSTQISNQSSNVGDTITDTVKVSNTGGYTLTGDWTLYGPVAPANGGCPSTGDSAWTTAPVAAAGGFTTKGDSDVVVGSYKITTSGCYTYSESIDSTSYTTAVADSPAGEVTETTIARDTPALVTKVSSQVAVTGASLTDTVTVTGTGGHTLTGDWKLLGPIAATDETTCAPSGDTAWSGAPTAGSGTFTAAGDGDYVTGDTVVAKAGCYTYVERLRGSDTSNPVGWLSPGDPAETSLVKSAPSLVTQVNSQKADVGSDLVDTVKVTGTDGNAITGDWKLLGPIAQVDGKCAAESDAAWTGAATAASGTFDANGDGDYRVGAFTVKSSGCYTYVESIHGSPTVWPFDLTPAGTPSETSLTKHRPELVTQINAQKAEPGATIIDTVTVSKTGGNLVNGEWKLLGPVAPVDGKCASAGSTAWDKAPVAKQGTFAAPADGDYQVGEFKVATVGCYTYQENLAEGPNTWAVDWHKPGINSETVIVKSSPTLVTQVNEQKVTTGATIIDTVTVSGTEGATVDGEWKLLGPIAPVDGKCAPQDSKSWAKAPIARRGSFTAQGDGKVRVGQFTVAKAGCYTYQERLLEGDGTWAFDWHKPGIASETVLAAPKPVTKAPTHPTVHSGGEHSERFDGNDAMVSTSFAAALLSALGAAFMYRRRNGAEA